MMSKKRKSLIILTLVLSIFLLYLGWIKFRATGYKTEYALAVRWEGLYKDKNFRDIGASINQCYGSDVMRTGLVFRSNGWFSGWSCNEVGNPEAIFSLNFNPEEREAFYCWNSDDKKPNIGKIFNPNIRLNKLEFLETWENKDEIRNSACRFIQEIFISIQENKITLIHCDAGRDRTAALASLLAAMTAEYNNMLNQNMLNAIECDYRKTKSLTPKKYGRMEKFIKDITTNRSISQFLESYCKISENFTKKTASMLAVPQNK